MRQDKDGRRYVGTSQVAKMLDVDRQTVIRWIESGDLEAWRTPGKHYRIAVVEVQRFLERKRVR